MKGFKRLLAAVMAAVIVAGIGLPAQTQAATVPKIKSVKVVQVDPDDNAAYLKLSTSGSGTTQGYEYKVYVNGKLKKKGDSGVWSIGSTKPLCKVELPAYSACTVRVRVNRGGAWSKWSGYVAAVPPVKVTSLNTSGSTMTLKWKKMAGATDYVVYIKPRSSSSWKKVKTVKGSTTSTKISVSGYDFYTYYDVRMIARKKVGSKYTGSKNWQLGYFYRYKTYR